MPLVAVVAPVGLQVHAVEGPRYLCGLLGLGLRAVALLRGPFFGEMGTDTPQGTILTGATASGFHVGEITRTGKIWGMTQLSPTIDVANVVQIDDGDHERFTHIVLEGFHPKKGDFIPVGNSVVAGIINAAPVRALCGKVWVPGKDPKKYPVCPTCREVAEGLGWSVPG